MIRRYAIVLFFFITACTHMPQTPSSRPNAEVIPFFGNFQVKRYTFENGLKLLVIEDPASPTFAYQTWFRVGSRDEVSKKTGLAHLFEHMMFKETKNLKDGEFDRILESAGAEGENAFTSRDYTAYVQELPKEQLATIIRVEAERMVNLIVDEKNFRTEREVVQNERRFRNENSPDGLMEQELFKLAFRKHSYQWPIIGYQTDLENMSAKDGEDFYHLFYNPDHATIIIVGDVQAEDTATMIQKYFGSIPRSSSSTRYPTPEPPQTAERRKRLKLNMQVEKLLIGYRIPDVTHADLPALAVLQSVLTGGKSARLHKALVETGISSSVEAYEIEGRDPSLFLMSTNLQNKKHADQAESVINRELARLRRKQLPLPELEKAKNNIQFSFYEGLSSNLEKAYFLGHYETLTERFENGIRRFQKIKTVQPDELRRVTQKYFVKKNKVVITGVQK